jgi:hypothetical protein
MAINNMSYKNGKLYCIRNTIDDDIYVGSTTQLLSKRMAMHRNKLNYKPHYKLYMKMADVGLDKFYIELIENCPCENKEELRTREGFVIREMGTLNSRIAGRNTKYWAIENHEHVKEHRQQYYEDYKATLQPKYKEFYNNNKAEITVKVKKYVEEEKELILQPQSTVIICECGRQVIHQGNSRHIKTQIHQQLMNELSFKLSEILNY